MTFDQGNPSTFQPCQLGECVELNNLTHGRLVQFDPEADMAEVLN
jgi:hypothetical protein